MVDTVERAGRETGGADGLMIGLKVWSINEGYVTPAPRLIEQGYCDFIEIYCIPGSGDLGVSLWKGFPVPIIVHAPHYAHGMNLSIRERERDNGRLFGEAARLAEAVGAEGIVVHGGTDGTIEELIRQLLIIVDERIIIENKPLLGQEDQICVGTSPEDIRRVTEKTGARFCLDITHAVLAATSLGRDRESFLSDFVSLEPWMYHLCDGLMEREKDIHLNIGQGNYDFSWILPWIPGRARVTLETPKNSTVDLDDFARDVVRLRDLVNTYSVAS